jgi:aspartate aminotransferase
MLRDAPLRLEPVLSTLKIAGVTATWQRLPHVNMRLAQRVQRIRPSATVSITALAARLRDEGRDIITLSVGEPDFPTPEHICEAARSAIDRGETKYTVVGGVKSLKQAVIDKFRRDNDLEFSLDEILISCGAKQSCFNACEALLEAGDEVIIPAPCWVSYPDMVQLADAAPVIVPTDAASGFKMTADELRASITESTRALILNSPCNPTGASYTRIELQALAGVLVEYPRIAIITDEIYEQLYWGTEPFCSLLSAAPELRQRTLTVNGVSKTYAMTGWRIGYAAGPAPLIKAMTSIQSQSTTSACSISQAAATAALTGNQNCVAAMRDAFRDRQSYVVDRLNALPGFDCQSGDGAFYAFPDVREALSSRDIPDDVVLCEQLLAEAGVALVPGTAFAAPGHLRLSFAADMGTLAKALDRLEHFFTTA